MAIAEASTEARSHLRQAEALLVVLMTVKADNLVGRAQLERVVCKAGHAEDGGLEPFRTSMWRRRLYESLAHLEQTGCIERSKEGYALTGKGEEKFNNLSAPPDYLGEVKAKIEAIWAGMRSAQPTAAAAG